MSDPHFNDDRIVEREVVERPVHREVVERPARRRYVSERRIAPGGMGTNNPMVLVIAGVLAVFILVLIFGYLL